MAKTRLCPIAAGLSDAGTDLRDAEFREQQRIRRLQSESRRGEREYFAHARMALVRFDRNGIIRSVNDAAGTLLLEERSALLGTSFVGRLSATDAEGFSNHLQQCGASGDCETVLVCLPVRDGKTRRLRLVSSAERDDGTGEPLILTALSDLTALMSVQENTEILNSFFTDHVHELAEANVALRVSIEEAEAFNAAVAHDLRTPLATIDICAQAVSRHCSHLLDAQCRCHLSKILSQADYMNRLIEALMNFSRASRSEIRKQPVDLAAIARVIAEQLRLEEPERPVRFEIQERLTAHGEPCLLHEVMGNLMGNAWKYSAGRDPAVIEVGGMHRYGNPVFFVRDNGIGFDMADAPQLFKVFKRLPGTETFAGYGVGLATVQRIVRRHGGRVWAESTAGAGATFYFTV